MGTTATDISRKAGDTYPIKATIKDGLTVMDLSGASDIALGIASSKAPAGSGVTTLTGALEGDGTDGALIFSDVAAAAALDPGTYYAEITFTHATYIYTTETFKFVLEPQIIA